MMQSNAMNALQLLFVALLCYLPLGLVEGFVVPSSKSSAQLNTYSSSLQSRTCMVVADAQEELNANRERRKGDNNAAENELSSSSSSQNAWRRTAGGYIPNLSPTQRRKSGLSKLKRFQQNRKATRTLHGDIIEVNSLEEYKKVVVDESSDCLVVVKFYADWCRSCKAVENHFKKLARHFSPTVKFVQVPLTERNAALHAGLGVPSLPFAHIYHPEAGLVEESKINRKKFGSFVKSLQSYVEGSCNVDYDSEASGEDSNSVKGVSLTDEEEALPSFS